MDHQQVSRSAAVVRIRRSRGIRGVNLREIWQYRDLFYYLVWRDIKARYAQSVLGIGWAVIQPFAYMIVFSIVFGRLVNVSSDEVPYPIFSYAALVPWTYFAQSLTGSADSLIRGSNMFTKVYFPRLILPLTPSLTRLVDFVIALSLVFGLMAWFGSTPTIWVLALPLLVLVMMLTASGLGMWITALAVQYRDVKFGMSFAVQLLMYASPVVYPASLIPDQYRLLYSLNPMVGIIEGFRSALLDTNPMPWDLLAVSGIVSIALAISGAFYFRRVERIFADVV